VRPEGLGQRKIAMAPFGYGTRDLPDWSAMPQSTELSLCKYIYISSI